MRRSGGTDRGPRWAEAAASGDVRIEGGNIDLRMRRPSPLPVRCALPPETGRVDHRAEVRVKCASRMVIRGNVEAAGIAE